MTEEQWLEGRTLTPMMTFLRRRGSDRKFYLVGCAGVRLIWDAVDVEECRACVECAEAYAEGEASRDQLRRVYRRADALTLERILPMARPVSRRENKAQHALRAAVFAAMPDGAFEAGASALSAALSAGKRTTLWPQQRALLHDVFRPFRPVRFDRTAVSAQVASLARGAYTERDEVSGRLDPARLAVLADALEESGVENPELLGHLRGPCPHVRGCWALDLLLGKS
jgi:hypothetical protein